MHDPSAYTADKQVCDIPAISVTLKSVSWNSSDITDRAVPLAEAIQDLCYDYLQQEHGGWEINDGSYGEFSFDVAERRVDLDFNARFTDSTHYSHTF